MSNQRNIERILGEWTGWSQNPASVFWIAIPLAVIGFGLCLLRAVLLFRLTGSWAFLAIWGGVMGLFGMSLWSMLRLHRSAKALSEVWRNDSDG